MKVYKNNAVVWLNKDKNGNAFLSFKAERDIKKGETLRLFKNKKGDVPSRPDYKSYTVTDDLEEKKEALLSDEETESINDEVPF